MPAPKYALKTSIVIEGSSPEEGYVVVDSHSAAMFSCNESARLCAALGNRGSSGPR